MAGPFMTVHQYDELKKLSEQHGKPDKVELCMDEEPYGIVYAVWAKNENGKIDIVHVKPDGEQMEFEQEYPDFD